MATVSPLVYRHAPQVLALLALAAIGYAVLILLVYAVTPWTGIDLPRLEGPQLAPFRWSHPHHGLA